MSKKRKQTGKTVSRADTPVKAVHLQRGTSAGTGYRIRLARPGEADTVQALLALSETPMSDEQVDAINSETLSAGLLPVLGTKQPFDALARSLATRASAGELLTGALELAMALVATTVDDRVVAALDAHPPGSLLPQAIDAGIDKNHALFSVLTVIKISSLAVDPDHRGNHLGAGLLKRCTQTYFQLGYQLAYGQFKITPTNTLADFYANRGFQLLDSRESISLEERLTLPITLGADHGEQMFYKWNPH